MSFEINDDSKSKDILMGDKIYSPVVLDKNFHAITLGRALRRLRKMKNMTQGKAAIAADISQSYLSHVEKGYHSLSLYKLTAFSCGINTPLRETFDVYCEEFEKLRIEMSDPDK